MVWLGVWLAALPPPGAAWQRVQSGDTVIDCATVDGVPWCRATAWLDATPERAAALLLDLPGHPRVFPRVASSDELRPGLAHQVLRLPPPLAPRDVVVALSHTVEGQDHVIRFDSVDRPDIPSPGVRLTRYAGEFRLHPEQGGVRLTYTWEAELGVEVPAFALSTAWRLEGNEIVDGLRAALAP